MSAIQTGADWWVDSVARFPGGTFGPIFGGALNQTAALLNGNSESSDSLSLAISNTQEVGEIGPSRADTEPRPSPIAPVAENIDSKSTEMGVSAEIVSAAAMRVGVVEATMRQHQTTGVVNFDDDEAHSGNDQPSNSSFKGAMLIALLQNPGAALASAGPSPDRLGLLWLLGH